MSKADDVLILGIGGAGSRVISALIAEGCEYALGAIDTDRDALDPLTAKNIPCILAGSGWTWREGSGCGGDVIRGEQAVARERLALGNLMAGKSLLIVVGGLGGGVATGGVRTLASVARTLNLPAVFLLTTPFSFESFARRKSAEDCLDDLLPVADIVMRMPNDLLFSMLPSETPFEEAFAKSSLELARSAAGVAGMLSCENSLGSDYATFMAALKGKKCSCGIGVGYGESSDGPDRCGIAVERMLSSPFLGGTFKRETTDAAAATISGGPDLELGEAKRTLENIAAMLPKKVDLLTGISIGEHIRDRVQVTVIRIKFDQSTQPQPRKEKTAGRRKNARAVEAPGALEQGLFELQTFDKGVFSGVAPTFCKGEDLDIPTYQRREITINKGVLSR